MSGAPTPAEAVVAIQTLPAVNLITAAVALGVSVSTASRSVAAGAFPVPVVRMGARVVVPTAPLRELLSIEPMPSIA
ncbi:hypothetical protein GCM10023147_08880 [Tsukamurella soli]|uniref:Helix-turn-helix domain-containing protein n=1 Tax=Tsukamurella soli TaxID=644556 RepID=A0ABP8J6S6_9ACTN